MKFIGRTEIVLLALLSLLLVAAGCSDDENGENGATGNRNPRKQGTSAMDRVRPFHIRRMSYILTGSWRPGRHEL